MMSVRSSIRDGCELYRISVTIKGEQAPVIPSAQGRNKSWDPCPVSRYGIATKNVMTLTILRLSGPM
jgi:hypothetical protein